MGNKSSKVFRTYDQIVIDTLREIEPATLKQLAFALNDNNTQSTWYLLKKLVKEDLIIIDIRNKPYKYTVKERVVSYD